MPQSHAVDCGIQGFTQWRWSIRAAPGASHFFIVTLRLFATAGFPPIRDRHGGLRPPYAYPSLRSIQPAHDGSALLSCHASLPSVYARLPCDSGQTRPGVARPGLCPSLQSIRGAAGFGRFVSHRVPPPAGGGIKSNYVFSGDMRLGKHSAQCKWGDNSEGIEPHLHCIPSKKSLDFFEALSAQGLLLPNTHRGLR